VLLGGLVLLERLVQWAGLDLLVNLGLRVTPAHVDSQVLLVHQVTRDLLDQVASQV